MRDIGTDDPRVHVRPGKRSRPRTKIRPDYSDRPAGWVTSVDRGRFGVHTEAGVDLMAVKARELGRRAVVVGDRVHLTGDLSGAKDTLARIAAIDERTSELTRSTEEGGGRERTIVANADTMAIVAAVSNPAARTGMIDRCLVAAHGAGMRPLLVLTKADLGSPEPILAHYRPLGIDIFVLEFDDAAAPELDDNAEAGGEGSDDEEAGAEAEGFDDEVAGDETADEGAEEADSGTVETDADRLSPDLSAEANVGDFVALREAINGRFTVLVGHSGVGKSTLLNHLVPHAERDTGHVNAVTGKGRHTSTSAVAFELEDGGRVVDTPGVRSFGLAHLAPEEILAGFWDLAPVTELCPRGCTHEASEPECALDELRVPRLVARVASFRRLLAGVAKEAWEI